LAYSTEEQITKLMEIRDGYINALVTDATNPKANYSLDGESIDRQGWRESLKNSIKDINELISILSPFEITTVQM
jgi:hypothetical protein